MSTPVLCEIADGIATLTLNRPEKLNAINYAMIDALSAALVGLNEQQGTKISVGGEDYFAAVAKLPKKATKELPGDYPPVTAGVAVLARETPRA